MQNITTQAGTIDLRNDAGRMLAIPAINEGRATFEGRKVLAMTFFDGQPTFIDGRSVMVLIEIDGEAIWREAISIEVRS